MSFSGPMSTLQENGGNLQGAFILLLATPLIIVGTLGMTRKNNGYPQIQRIRKGISGFGPLSPYSEEASVMMNHIISPMMMPLRTYPCPPWMTSRLWCELPLSISHDPRCTWSPVGKVRGFFQRLRKRICPPTVSIDHQEVMLSRLCKRFLPDEGLSGDGSADMGLQ